MEIPLKYNLFQFYLPSKKKKRTINTRLKNIT